MKFRSVRLAMVLALGLLPLSTFASIDSDGDGVADERDECPQTPANTPVDKRGCALKKEVAVEAAVSEEPSCPPPPAGAVVDSYGCAVDEDGDGVPDGLDQCPHSTRGLTVDVGGCVQAIVKESAPAPARPGKQRLAAKKLSEPLPPIPEVSPRQSATVTGAPETTAIPVTEPVIPVAVAPPTPAPPVVVAPKPVREVVAPAPQAAPRPTEIQPSPAVARLEPAAVPVVVAAVVVDPTRYAAVSFAAGSAELSADAMSRLEVLARGFVQASSAKSSLKLEIRARAGATGDGRHPEVLAQERFDLLSVYLQAQGVAKARISGGTQVDRDRSARVQPDGRLAEIKVIE